MNKIYYFILIIDNVEFCNTATFITSTIITMLEFLNLIEVKNILNFAFNLYFVIKFIQF